MEEEEAPKVAQNVRAPGSVRRGRTDFHHEGKTKDDLEEYDLAGETAKLKLEDDGRLPAGPVYNKEDSFFDNFEPESYNRNQQRYRGRGGWNRGSNRGGFGNGNRGRGRGGNRGGNRGAYRGGNVRVFVGNPDKANE